MSANSATQQRPGTVSRRDFLGGAGSAAIATSFAATAARTLAAPARTARPNILLIITDQQHIDTIAAAGCAHTQTPAMDRLATRGTLFTQSYSANPLCSPARAAIFTGRTSCETGVYQNGLPIRSDIPNLGQWLAEQAGYETIYAGKWHVPRSFTNFIPGFAVINTGIGGQGNIGDTCTSQACETYLRNRSANAPFLLVASFLQPHDICEWLRLNSNHLDALPYPELRAQLPPLPGNFGFDPDEPATMTMRRLGNEACQNEWTEEQWRYYIWSYYRHVEMVDAEVGRVLQALDDSGCADNTVVVFTADHGEGTAHHQMTRKNQLYDEAVKVPFIISWPGRLPAGGTDRVHLITGMDIMPTLCDCVGIKPPPNMRGTSLRPLLEGRTVPGHAHVVAEVHTNTARMVRTAQHKYIKYVDDPVEQLFDLRNDPGELRNLARDSGHADALREHRKLLLDWETSLDVAPKVPHAEKWRQA